MSRRPADFYHVPRKPIDAKTLRITLLPRLEGVEDQALIFRFEIAILEIDNFKGDLKDFMDLGVQAIGFCIEKDAEHSIT